MKTIEIVEVDDPKDAAELCYEVDGVWTPDSEYVGQLKQQAEREQERERLWGKIGWLLIAIALGAWLFVVLTD
jgi:hypothetical protein